MTNKKIIDISNYQKSKNQIANTYKHEFRSRDERWKNRKQSYPKTSILGISSGSKYATSGEKLDIALNAIRKQTDHLYISNTSTPYQYTLIAEGHDPIKTFQTAKELGQTWLTNNKDILEHHKDAFKSENKTIKIINWIDDIRNTPYFSVKMSKFFKFYNTCIPFRQAIEKDIYDFILRKEKRGMPDKTNPFFWNLKASLEKMTGYWIMTEELQKKYRNNSILYFHNGSVSPQIDFFRTHAHMIPKDTAQPLLSTIYVDITFRRRKKINQQTNNKKTA